jgi:hypothetical protein
MFNKYVKLPEGIIMVYEGTEPQGIETESGIATTFLVDSTRFRGDPWQTLNSIADLVLPSGYVNIAIENDHRNSGFSH